MAGRIDVQMSFFPLMSWCVVRPKGRLRRATGPLWAVPFISLVDTTPRTTQHVYRMANTLLVDYIKEIIVLWLNLSS